MKRPVCYIPIRIHTYIHTHLLFYVVYLTMEKKPLIYRWIQNCSAGSCLSFRNKGKMTTATPKVNTFKIVS